MSSSHKQDHSRKDSVTHLTQKLKHLLEQKDSENALQFIEREMVSKETVLIWMSIVIQCYSAEMSNIVRSLIRKGGDVDGLFLSHRNHSSKYVNKDNMTILMFICDKGDVELLDIVLEYTCNVNACDMNGKSAMMYAIMSGKGDDVIVKMVRRLIERGGDVNGEMGDCARKGMGRYSPLSMAAEKGLTKTMMVLIERGSDVNYKTSPDEETVLHIAVRKGNVEMVREVLKKEGVLLEERNREGKTPKDLAEQLVKKDIYESIMEKIEENKKNSINKYNEHYIHNEQSLLISNRNEYFNLNKDNIIHNRRILQEYNEPKYKQIHSNKTSVLKIPFTFCKNITNYSNITSYFNFSNSKDPELIIDLSSDSIDLEQKHSQTLIEKNNIISNLESEHSLLKQELEKQCLLNSQYLQQEEAEKISIDNLTEQLTFLSKQNEELQKTINLLEKENKDLHFKLSQDSQSFPNSHTTMNQYLNKKYIHFTYDPTYLFNCLSKDIIEYQQYVYERLQNEQHHYTMLIQNLQHTVNDCLKEYDVRLYGSHATGLCLPWSDLDVVLIPRSSKIGHGSNQMLLKQLFDYIRQQPWVKDAKFIASASMPIIKLISVSQYNSIPIDISIQDERHFGLQCVELVKNFISQYESLKPLVLALKNILKQANLNDPYKGGISSYGLILMIVSFLQTQKRSGLDISVSHNNLGKLFFDCVNYYGLQFDPAKYIIYARKTEDDESDEINLQVSIISFIYIL